MWVSLERLSSWREKKRKQIEADFRFFASQGISAVRWFLLADGLNYGMGEFAPRSTSGTWVFDPLPAGHSFYESLRDDFEFVLQLCLLHGLKLFPSLIDFYWCRQGSTLVAGQEGIVKGGRQDVVRDPEKRRNFFDRLFEPLLESSAQFRDSLYAWELINEPEWAIRKESTLQKRDGNPNVSRQEMREFIAEGVNRIHTKRLPDGNPAFPSSVGFAHWENLGEWDVEGLGITLHQFHYYAQHRSDLPEYSSLKTHPCVVGEFATATGREWPDLKLLSREQSLGNRLRRIEEKGYPACFLWSARAADKATRWTDEERRQVIAYTRAGPTDDLQA